MLTPLLKAFHLVEDEDGPHRVPRRVTGQQQPISDDNLSFVVDDADALAPIVGRGRTATTALHDEEATTAVVDDSEHDQAPRAGRVLFALPSLVDDEISFVVDDSDGDKAPRLSLVKTANPTLNDEDAAIIALDDADSVRSHAVGSRTGISAAPVADEELPSVPLDDESQAPQAPRRLRLIPAQPATDDSEIPVPPTPIVVAAESNRRSSGGDWPESNMLDPLDRDYKNDYFDHNVADHNAALIAEAQLEDLAQQLRELISTLADEVSVEVAALDTQVVVDSVPFTVVPVSSADGGVKIGQLDALTTVPAPSASVDILDVDVSVFVPDDDND